MANCPIKNTKLLEEAFDAGYYRGLQEQNGTVHPPGGTPPYVPPSLSSAGIQQYQGKFSTAARGGKGSQSSPWGAGPDIRNLPPWYDGSSLSAMAWMMWFFDAFEAGTIILQMSMPPSVNWEQYGWSPEITEMVSEAFDAMTAMLYQIDNTTSPPTWNTVGGGWVDINAIMYILRNWQSGTPPFGG